MSQNLSFIVFFTVAKLLAVTPTIDGPIWGPENMLPF